MNKVKIVEVGPRDGLQNEKTILPLEIKFEFIKKLTETGLTCIEITSFVKASAIPQMSDAVDLFTKIKNELPQQISYPCLVPNLKGYETAKSLGVKEIALFSATSDAFTARNINSTVDESFVKMKEVADEARKDGIKVRGYISTAFGCPYEGEEPVEKLVSVTKRFFELGVYEVSVGDTIGVARPQQVRDYLRVLTSEFDVNKLAMHFHDTRGMAMTNILVSLEKGIRTFDSSAGGLGGCPYAKGATGNVATEDVWYLCHSMGMETGINLDKLVEAGQYILEKLGKMPGSKFHKAYVNTGRI